MVIQFTGAYRFGIYCITCGEKLKVDLNQFIEKNYPESFALAGDICKELGKDLNHEFLDNETGYLAIHIEQIKCDEMISE